MDIYHSRCLIACYKPCVLYEHMLQFRPVDELCWLQNYETRPNITGWDFLPLCIKHVSDGP